MRKLENFWIAILWVLIFLLVLVWDQEKIVVINLIVFCYFLYYLGGQSIETALAQRQRSLFDALVAELNTQAAVLKNLIMASKIACTNYKNIVLHSLKRLIVNTGRMTLLFSSDFVETENKQGSVTSGMALALVSHEEQICTTILDQNLLVVQQLAETATNELFVASTETNEENQ